MVDSSHGLNDQLVAGVSSVLLHSLPYIDRDHGEAAALEVYQAAKLVAAAADGSEGASVLRLVTAGYLRIVVMLLVTAGYLWL